MSKLKALKNKKSGIIDDNKIVQLCYEVAQGFKPRAEAYDREGKFPTENFQDLKDAGLLGILVPEEHGGLGADFSTYTKAIEQLAKGDTSTALTFNMHNIAIGSLAELNIGAIEDTKQGQTMVTFRDWMFKEAAVNKKLFASAASEAGVGAKFSEFKTSYRHVEGGFLLNGSKSWVSMAENADYYVVVARAEEIDSADTPLSFLIVEHGNPNVTWENTWDVLGMRGTSTNPMHMKDCFVPTDKLFLGSEGYALLKVVREPHWLVGGYIGVYLGICQASFEFLVAQLKSRKIPGTDKSRADDPVIQYQIGEIYSKLLSARNATQLAARLVDESPGSVEANTAIHNSKYICSELGPWITAAAIRLLGASALTKKLPLERWYRDARCGGLMPATSDACLSYLGNMAFGADLTKPGKTYW
ncbi:MAG: alkylation response protein AidB-like acyl-CoA dehydrogenase [Flavobacteriales bacterium]|jgi:alkylation response protein AidB-like acyl-CoA dehydrogenase